MPASSYSANQRGIRRFHSVVGVLGSSNFEDQRKRLSPMLHVTVLYLRKRRKNKQHVVNFLLASSNESLKPITPKPPEIAFLTPSSVQPCRGAHGAGPLSSSHMQRPACRAHTLCRTSLCVAWRVTAVQGWYDDAHNVLAQVREIYPFFVIFFVPVHASLHFTLRSCHAEKLISR